MNIQSYQFEDLFITKESRFKAKSYFGRVMNGQEEDYRTPYFNEAPREFVLGKWLDRLKALSKKGFSMVPGLMEFENEMAEKVGPLSIMMPLRDRMKDIEAYYTCIRRPSVPIEPEAIYLAQNHLSMKHRIKVTPFGYLQTVNDMRLSTNSGVPYFIRRRKVVNDTIKLIDKDEFYVAILGWRGQEGGPDVEDVKQRVVWMFPFAVNIKELSMYTPLIKAWQAMNINSAYISMRAVEEKMTKLFDTKGDEYVLVTDFSKFDQHFNYDLQNAAEEIIGSMVNDYQGEEWLREVFPIKYKIPLAISDSIMITGQHGMGSGSGGTNFDECCAHTALQYEAALLNNATLNPYSNAYGDDGYLSYNGINPDDVIKCYTSHGQEMNPAKQTMSKHSAVYLRRYFHDSYRDNKGIMLGIYATTRALGRIMGQERYWDKNDEVSYREYLTLRSWSMIENCNNHPFFEEFVDYVIEGDKYKLGLAIPGFMERLDNTFDKLRYLDPDVLGFTKTLQSGNTGIKDWRIFKYLKTLS